MNTKRTIENLGGLHPLFRPKAEDFLAAAQQLLRDAGVSVEILSGLRSWRQQAALYASGRTKPGRIVTRAKPGTSWHNFGLAIDLGLFRDGRYLDEREPAAADKLYASLAPVAGHFGLEWAGNWKTFSESPHYQWTNGNTLPGLRLQMEANGYAAEKLLL